MSATRLAAFVVACLVVVLLAGLATVVVWKLRPRSGVNEAAGWLALALGLGAGIVFGVGAAIANHDPNDPGAESPVHGCQAGTYDNGARGDGPKCFPFPPGTGR